jgi:hypothetical protein
MRAAVPSTRVKHGREDVIHGPEAHAPLSRPIDVPEARGPLSRRLIEDSPCP